MIGWECVCLFVCECIAANNIDYKVTVIYNTFGCINFPTSKILNRKKKKIQLQQQQLKIKHEPVNE